MRLPKDPVLFFCSGLIVGFLAGLWAAIFLSQSSMIDWRCTSYSPVTGQCVLMQHTDYIPTPEDARD